MIDQVTVDITPATFVRETDRERITRPWSSVKDITIDERLIVFHGVDRLDYFVPVTAFPSPSMAEAYCKKAVRYWKGEGEAGPDEDEGTTWPPPPRMIIDQRGG
jgi:hypothetical protein